MKYNIVIGTDSYKAGQAKLYKPGTQVISSYLESRGGNSNDTIFFGLQYYLKRYLQGVVVTKQDIDEAEKFWNAHFGRKDYFDRSKWDYIVDKWGGVLPVTIRAVREGTRVPVLNVLMVIENTDEQCFWLTNWLETLLMKVFYPISIATRSNKIYEDVLYYLKKSGSPEDVVWKCHDFGYRGCTSEETSALGSAAHLVAGFMGSDTVSGVRLLQEYYGANMPAFSIPATEHSNICSYGRDGESEVCERYLKLFPEGLIACVSDTYNIYNACQNIWGDKLKDVIKNRNGLFVIRPDSGEPCKVVPQVLNILLKKFGATINDKGYRVLNHCRVIQGDGMKSETINKLYETILEEGWSADNLAVGSGGGLLTQDITRDTHKFAIKASAAKINDEWVEIYKDPITDLGKQSKKGRLKLIKNPKGLFVTVKDTGFRPDQPDQLIEVFRNGVCLVDLKFDDIKKRVKVE